MEELSSKSELPAGLSWSNTLVTLNGPSLVRSAREQFRGLLAERPDDLDLQERVRGYFEGAKAGFAQDPEHGAALIEALGEFEDILPRDT